MKRVSALLICACLAHFAVVTAQAEQPALVFGTYLKGNNVTEPRPKKSSYLETLHGGIVVIGNQAGFYLNTRVIKQPEKDLYIVIEYENPSGGKPFVNDMLFKTDAEELDFSSPDFVKGLRSYADYTITVRVFDSKDATVPLDTLRQKIRCYVDTRGSKLKMFKGLKTKSL